MAKLTGIHIYKLLPKTNCGECNFPTCMAFAMQVAAKKIALEACPYASEDAKRELAESAAPPMRVVTIGVGPGAVQIGGETVLFRHEEKFHRPTALAIRISDTDRLNDAMVGTGFPYNKVERMGQGLKFFKRMIMEIQAIRRDGSAALNLCYVACGRFDGFWELTLHPWDIAAGWLIVEEAGGMVTRLDGSKMIMNSPDIVASNGILHDGICKTLNKVDS